MFKPLTLILSILTLQGCSLTIGVKRVKTEEGKTIKACLPCFETSEASWKGK